MGFVTLGCFLAYAIVASTGSSVGAGMGIDGATIQMVSHGLISGAMFLCVGVLYDRVHSRQIADYGGVANTMPVFSAFFVLFAMAHAGLPGTSGFVGEFLILMGSFETARWWTIIAATGVILAALYLLWAYQRVFHGEPDEENAKFAELNLREGALIGVFIVIIGFTGLYPKPMLDRIEPSVNKLIEHVESKSDYVAPEIKSSQHSPAEGDE
jgi:NADH-quinone oxidoreductase subunit M